MAAYSSVLGLIWRRSRYGGGVPNLFGDLDPSGRDLEFGFVGSSKGWVCLMNMRTRQMNLINPITRRCIDLPAPHPFKDRTTGDVFSPHQIILSGSPDEEGGECRALIAYPRDLIKSVYELAFCCPGQSDTWTPLGEYSHYLLGSFAYSRRQKLFFYAKGGYTTRKLYAWDLRDPLSPKTMTDRMDDLSTDRMGNRPRFLLVPDEDMMAAHRWYSWLWDSCLLVSNEDTGDLFVVSQFMSYEDYYYFDVHRYDPETGALTYMEGSLDGLSFFVGAEKTGFAVSAEEFPELKPDSIYFAFDRWDPKGRNVGIYNYKDATVSPLCGLPGFGTSELAPVGWFTPNTSN